MATKVWAAALVLGIGLTAVVAQGQSQGQDQGQAVQGTPTTANGTSLTSGKSPDHAMQMGKPAIQAGPLKIAFGDKSSEWTPATLAALPHKRITVYNEHAKTNQTYGGVELIDLLTPLGIPAKPHGKDFRFYLVAEGSDGYQVVYSIGEVTPDVHDGTIMVADSLDTKPLAESGPLQLVITGDVRPARWVRNLVAIRVRQAE